MSSAVQIIGNTSLVDGAGRRVAAQVVHCGFCRSFDTISANAHGGLPPDVARKKFVQRGWQIGKRVKCPRCVAKSKNTANLKPESKVTPMIQSAKAAPLKTMADLAVVKQGADAPREMTANDRRRVFRAIDDTWDDANGRYLGDATDHQVAVSLVVPRVWVETIRRENFGEVSSNDEIEKLRAELTGFIGIVDGHCNEALAQAGRFDAVLKGLGDLRARLDRIEKSVGLRK